MTDSEQLDLAKTGTEIREEYMELNHSLIAPYMEFQDLMVDMTLQRNNFIPDLNSIFNSLFHFARFYDDLTSVIWPEVKLELNDAITLEENQSESQETKHSSFFLPSAESEVPSSVTTSLPGSAKNHMRNNDPGMILKESGNPDTKAEEHTIQADEVDVENLINGEQNQEMLETKKASFSPGSSIENRKSSRELFQKIADPSFDPEDFKSMKGFEQFGKDLQSLQTFSPVQLFPGTEIKEDLKISQSRGNPGIQMPGNPEKNHGAFAGYSKIIENAFPEWFSPDQEEPYSWFSPAIQKEDKLKVQGSPPQGSGKTGQVSNNARNRLFADNPFIAFESIKEEAVIPPVSSNQGIYSENQPGTGEIQSGLTQHRMEFPIGETVHEQQMYMEMDDLMKELEKRLIREYKRYYGS